MPCVPNHQLAGSPTLPAGGWFVWHHFWFLEVSLAGVPLRTVCGLVVAGMVPATLLPGLLYAGVELGGVVMAES